MKNIRSKIEFFNSDILADAAVYANGESEFWHKFTGDDYDFALQAVVTRVLLENHAWDPSDETMQHVSPARYRAIMNDAAAHLSGLMHQAVEEVESRLDRRFAQEAAKNKSGGE